MKRDSDSKSGKKAQRSPALKPRRVVVIDDHALVRQGLMDLLNSRSGLSVVGEAETATLGLEQVRKHKPDLVILDLSLPQRDGLELVKQIKSEFPALPILVMSMHDEAVYAERAVRAGARGYLMKKEPSEKIFIAIEQIIQGGLAVSERVKEEMLEFTITAKHGHKESGSIMDRLSDRELEVFRLLGQGFSTRSIAEQLHLSVKTIESYRENLKVKLNLASSVELLQRAIQWDKSQTM